MTLEQAEKMRRQQTKVTLARKRLLEVAVLLDGCPEIKGSDPYVTTQDLAMYLCRAVDQLDFALDQFESFMKEGK